MSTPDNALEEWQTRILRLLQRYEGGEMTLRALARELAAYSPAYERARGSIDDPYALFLRAGCALVAEGEAADLGGWDAALREFRRSIW
jgi:hypothetical protein